MHELHRERRDCHPGLHQQLFRLVGGQRLKLHAELLDYWVVWVIVGAVYGRRAWHSDSAYLHWYCALVFCFLSAYSFACDGLVCDWDSYDLVPFCVA